MTLICNIIISLKYKMVPLSNYLVKAQLISAKSQTDPSLGFSFLMHFMQSIFVQCHL